MCRYWRSGIMSQRTDSVAAMAIDIDTLTKALQASWGSDTSDDRDIWRLDNRARGQCAVTAKVVQDCYGGTLPIASVLSDGESVEAHCWNVLPSGEHVDLTASQSGSDYEIGEAIEKEPVVDHTGINRHHLLAEGVSEYLAKQ